MIKQDIICTCKEDVDTEKKYIYTRDIYTQKDKFLLRTLLSFINYTYNREMRDRNVYLLPLIFCFLSLYYPLFRRLNIFTSKYT